MKGLLDHTQKELVELIRENPGEAVDLLKAEIGNLEFDEQIAARSVFLLIAVSHILRMCLKFDEDQYEDLMVRLARLSILVDDRLGELMDEWWEEVEAGE